MSAILDAARPKVRRSSFTALDESNPLLPYLFLLPHAILFFVFIVYPVLYGLWISLHRWDPLQDSQPFVGLTFYAKLFDFSTPQAQQFWNSLLNTTFFVAISTPLLIGVALALALQLQRPIFGRALFRAIFFMPGILSVSVMALLWRWMFENGGGLVNVLREETLGLPSVPWLTTEWLAWTPIVVGTVWWTVGFNMTLYLAGLGNIPKALYEAAAIDGARPWQQFRFVTWPMLQPTTLFIGVTTILASFQLFGQSQLITNGGPTRTTQSVIHYITDEAFLNNQFSGAAAMSIVFGLIMLVFTVFQFRLMTGSSPGER